MTATTLTRPVRNDPSSTGTTGSKRQIAAAVAIAVLVAASFLISRVTMTHHAATFTAIPKLSAADAAQIAGDVSPVTVQLSAADAAQVAGDVAPITIKLSAANSAQIAGDVASVSAPDTVQLSPADRAIIAGDVASVTSHLTPADAAQVAN
jgi:hypothetical protein